MGQGAQNQADARGARRLQRSHRVAGQTGEEGPSGWGAEPPGEGCRRQGRTESAGGR